MTTTLSEGNTKARKRHWCAGPEDAYEWATETVIYGTPEDQRAAKKYLERTNHD